MSSVSGGPRDVSELLSRRRGDGPASDDRAALLEGITAPAPRGRLSVLHVITRLNVGGPARHVLDVCARLHALGHRAVLVHGSTEPAECPMEDVRGGGAPCIRLRGLRRSIAPWHDLRALTGLTRLLLVERPDVVHTHTAKAGTIGRLAAAIYNAIRRRSARCLVVHTFHGHVFEGYFGPAGSAAVRIVERAMAACTDRVLTVSGRQREDVVERFRIVPPAKCDVIEVGTDLRARLTPRPDSSLKTQVGIPEGDVVFGFVGRFVPVKDLPMLVNAFALVRRRIPAAWLLMVGDGPERARVAALCGLLGVGDRVVFTGWRHDMAAVYGALDIGVLASRQEGTPLALIEAMAAGRPVVSTAAGGVADVVAHGRTGLLVPPGNVAAMAEAMALLASDAALRARFGADARREIDERFGVDRAVTAMVSLYSSLLPALRGIERSRRALAGEAQDEPPAAPAPEQRGGVSS